MNKPSQQSPIVRGALALMETLWLVILLARPPQSQIMWFRTHLLFNQEEFRVAQHQAGPHIFVLLIVPGFWLDSWNLIAQIHYWFLSS